MEKIIVIDNSPVEFVLGGPLNGRDRLLIKSSSAQLDLIGVAADFERNDGSELYGDVLSLFLPRIRELNSVVSYPQKDLNETSDGRYSSFVFAWDGYVSRTNQKWIQDYFNRLLPDIQEGIATNDRNLVEWNLAPIIRLCAAEKSRRRRRRKIMGLTMGAYMMAVVVVLAFQFLSKSFKF